MTPQKAQQKNRLQLFRLASQLLFLSATAFSLIQMNFILTGVLLAIALLGGSFYCGWLCPFGLFQEILSWLGKKILPSGKVLKIPLKLEKKTDHFPLRSASCWPYITPRDLSAQRPYGNKFSSSNLFFRFNKKYFLYQNFNMDNFRRCLNTINLH